MATGSFSYPPSHSEDANPPLLHAHSHGTNAEGARDAAADIEMCLILVSGSAATPLLDLSRHTHVGVGRQLDNCLVIHDATCSRRHCVLTKVHGVWQLEDLFSRNGTYVNGQRIFSQYPLCNGDILQLGCTRLQFSEIPRTDG